MLGVSSKYSLFATTKIKSVAFLPRREVTWTNFEMARCGDKLSEFCPFPNYYLSAPNQRKEDSSRASSSDSAPGIPSPMAGIYNPATGICGVQRSESSRPGGTFAMRPRLESGTRSISARSSHGVDQGTTRVPLCPLLMRRTGGHRGALAHRSPRHNNSHGAPGTPPARRTTPRRADIAAAQSCLYAP